MKIILIAVQLHLKGIFFPALFQHCGVKRTILWIKVSENAGMILSVLEITWMPANLKENAAVAGKKPNAREDAERLHMR